MNAPNPLAELERVARHVHQELRRLIGSSRACVPRAELKPLTADAGLLWTAINSVARSTLRTDEILRKEWREKLEAAIKAPTFVGRIERPRCVLVLDYFELHELYTVLVDPTGEPEACCAGCTRLPPGWCATCDEQRKAEN